MITIKTPQEIEIMRAGGKILAMILDKVVKAVKPGATTKELDELARQLIFYAGAKPAFLGYNGFPASLCTSINEVIVHAAPGGDKLKEGDIVGLDLGILYPSEARKQGSASEASRFLYPSEARKQGSASEASRFLYPFKDCDGCFMAGDCPSKTRLAMGGPPEKKVDGFYFSKKNKVLEPEAKGLYTDMAITVPVGKISQEAQKLIDVTKQALEIGLEQVKPGNHIGDIGFVIQQYVESQGFSVIRNLVGHGVGEKIHEPPNIPNFGKRGEGEKLKSGMTLAIEPMVSAGGHKLEKLPNSHGYKTKDKSLTAHFEHTVVVTKKGYEVLTLHT